MDSLISTFHIDWKLMAAQLVNFAIVLVVLYFAALKPLKKLMDERGKTIQGGLDNAKLQAQLVAAQKEEYEKTLAQARTEAAGIMKEVKKDAEARRADMLQKAQADTHAVVEAGTKQLQAEKQKMVEEAKKEIVSMVVSATEKVLGQSVNAKIESALVEGSMKELS